MSKIVLVAVGAAGYVLGARAGRERYDQIADQAQKFWSNPKVAQKRQEAKSAAMAQAPAMKEKFQDVTGTSASGSDNSMSQESTPAATQPVV